MSEDFEQEDVIDLAEKIFIENVSISNIHSTITREAQESIQAAMIFRQVQLKIFKDKD